MKQQRTVLLGLLIFALSRMTASGQMPPAISIEPSGATAWDELTLTYDPDQGCTPSGKGSLVGSPRVMMHSACFYIEFIDRWGSEWGQSTVDYDATPRDGIHTTTDLTPNGDGTYSITFTPADYYGAAEGKIIIGLTMVFNNGSWASEGKDPSRGGCGDFYVPLNYNPGLFVRFTRPEERPLFVGLNDTIEAEVAGNEADSLFFLRDNQMIAATDKDTLRASVIADETGEHWLKAIAKDDSDQVADSVWYFVTDPVVTEALPDGMIEGINHTSDSTVVLVLFAPEKERVFLTGDFNDWNTDNDYQMKRTPGRDYYWLELNLQADTFYRYQYLVDGSLRIGDPYAELVLDEYNDQFISEQTYPGLIPYPEGKTENLVTVLFTSPVEYEWQTENFTPPEKEELVIYELLIRDFLQAHDYKTLIDTLPYLEKLGINAIELMPVNEFEGNHSWGYNPSFYFAPDKYYGPKEDLKAFIDTCHSRGIAVIIDMVLNHSFGQSPMVRMYWEGNRPAANNPWFNQEPKHDFNVGFDMNHDSEATRRFARRVNRFWLEEYRVDGFRFDLSKGFTQKNTLGDVGAWGRYDASRVALWKSYADSIWNVNPDAYVILEHFADNDEEKELTAYGMMVWGNTVYNYARAGMGWNYDGKSDVSWGVYKTRSFSKPHLVAYMESHDEQRQWLEIMNWGNNNNPNYIIRQNYQLTGIRAELAAALFYTVPGPKMLWQFGELGYDYSINYDCRVCNKPIRWDYYDDPVRQRLYQAVGALINLKTGYEAFNSADFSYDLSDTIKRVQIRHPSMDVCVVGNFDTYQREAGNVFTGTGTWYDYFTGDSLVVTDLDEPLSLQKSEYHIYTSVKLPVPGIISAPQAMEVTVSGELSVGSRLTGSYRYLDLNGDPEGDTKFQWYRGKFANGAQKQAIEGATAITYTLTGDDWDHYLFFEVIPVAAAGQLTEGVPEYALFDVATAIGGVTGQNRALKVYPNPSPGGFRISFTADDREAVTLQVINISGQLIHTSEERALTSGTVILHWDGTTFEGTPAPAGPYLLRVVTETSVHSVRLMKTRHK